MNFISEHEQLYFDKLNAEIDFDEMFEMLTMTVFGQSVQIRYTTKNGVKWYLVNDISAVLEYSDTRAVKSHAQDNIRKLTDLKRNITFKKTTYCINEDGFRKVLLRSQKPRADVICTYLGINMLYKAPRIELQIVVQIQNYLAPQNIKVDFQKYVKPRKIDLFLPDHLIAIEVDENGHSSYNRDDEIKRETYIKNVMKCVFLRYNPDSPDFDICKCLGEIANHIRERTPCV